MAYSNWCDILRNGYDTEYLLESEKLRTIIQKWWSYVDVIKQEITKKEFNYKLRQLWSVDATMEEMTIMKKM